MDARIAFAEMFSAPRALIGMVHVGALPGSPAAREPVSRLVEQAVAEARAYREAGFTAVAIENMHDRPYIRGGTARRQRLHRPEVTAAMAVIGREIRRETELVLGVQVLAGANREALAVAQASGAAFVRVEGFVFAHVADEGPIEASAGELLRYRRAIGAEDVRVFADIKKKHAAHAITADVSLAETARARGVLPRGRDHRRRWRPPASRRRAADVEPRSTRRGSRCSWARASRREHSITTPHARLHRRLVAQAGRRVVEPARPGRVRAMVSRVRGTARGREAGPRLVLLGNLLVDDVVFATARHAHGSRRARMLYAALAASLWGVRTAA
jgi:membrane complex biogenesis BtpA family protein